MLFLLIKSIYSSVIILTCLEGTSSNLKDGGVFCILMLRIEAI
ncbi:hypothetical protein KIS4809_0011 [Bacillus sp. ZZV12-4809]|nr:hypothetical protein KIS4809_0011 [Bacillus sp. ZZV12-4809]